MSYKHLTTFERSRIEVLHQQGFSAQVTVQKLEEALILINSRPRKCLGWKTSYEAFMEELSHLT